MTAPEAAAEHHIDPRTIVERIAVPVLIGAVAAAAILLFWYAVLRTPPFDPIDFTIQRVERIDPDTGNVIVPTVEGRVGPAVRLGESVPVRGDLIVNADRSISVRGSLVWSQVNPDGFRCAVQEGVPGQREPGTYPLVFDNPIPDCVIDRVNLVGPTEWRINGLVEVLEPGGVDATWTTETFWVVPDGE